MKFILSTLVLASLKQLVSCFPQPQIEHISRAASGCGKMQFLTGVTQYRFGLKSSGIERSYSYHLPSDYEKNKQYPVVLGFHGSSSVGLFFELDTRMSEARYSGDKIMVYPNGIEGSWAGPTYHTKSTVAEDIQFVQDVIDDMKARVCVDDGKIYAVGMSNGGGFVGTLACDIVGSTLFNAFAMHSGSFYTDVNGPSNGCVPRHGPRPVLEIHGGADKTVKYNGGQGDGGLEPPIASWLDWWAQRNGCSNKSEESLIDGDVQHLSWTCGGIQGLLQHYKVIDMGHCWADTEPNLSQISVPQGPSSVKASEIVMRFFNDVSSRTEGASA
ncbi:carbohydrate esterase family 1 protein [Pleomassaria siparia CBS 279.74]|uniref:feruloyl esterase n=1 Tax=Pleomassaria siparia CBS 279.74 TaxID=1314801 RepID=A0A6G1KND3_9PLEO|nr:carbohydrate esterase family 1 protein [Pleomassaria siparia CBS 279.74]